MRKIEDKIVYDTIEEIIDPSLYCASCMETYKICWSKESLTEMNLLTISILL